jgi:hypothetical protein
MHNRTEFEGKEKDKKYRLYITARLLKVNDAGASFMAKVN